MWFGRNKSDAITSLKLEKPVEPAPSELAAGSPSSSATTTPSYTAAEREWVQRRTGEIMAAKNFPSHFYILVDQSTRAPLLFAHKETRRSLPIFASPIRALDYLRTCKLGGVVGGFKLDDIAVVNVQWRAAGIDSFIMNKCPRCTVHNILTPKDGLIERGQLCYSWALSRAIRDWKGRDLARRYLALKGDKMVEHQRTILEGLRDHIDYDNPYVHWMLAINARVRGDEEGRAASIERMNDFGPEFRTTVAASEAEFKGDSWIGSMVEAQIGLMASFEMFDLSKGTPGA